MRNKTILAMATALLATACGTTNEEQGDRCVINGKVEGWQEADSVIIATMSRLGVSGIDTAVVTEGQFSLKVKADDGGFLAHVMPLVGGKPMAAYEVLVEPGTEFSMTLPAETEAQPLFEGSKSNALWQELHQKSDAFEKEAEPYFSTLRDPEAAEADKAAAEHTLDSLYGGLQAAYASYIKSNIPSFFSDILLGMVASALDDSTKAEIIAEMGKHEPALPNYTRIKARMTLEATTATGSKFIDFSQPDKDGKEVKLSDMVKANKLTMVDFWASWCGPCRNEMPTVVKAYATYKAKGLEILGVSLDQDRSAWLSAVEKLGMTWPQVSDLNGWTNSAAQAYVVDAIPSCFLINQDGVIVGKNLRGDELLSKVDELLK